MIGFATLVRTKQPDQEERLVSERARTRRQGRRAKTVAESVRNFLTPTVIRQVRNVGPRRRKPRWDLYPLIHVLLVMTWVCGDSLPEKFEAARGFYVVCCPKRKRPGKSFQGFEKAVSKLPMPVLRTLAGMIRGRIDVLFDDRLLFVSVHQNHS